MIKKIAITGPESTGKSALAQALAQRFQTTWVPEFAREYLKKTNGKYAFEDIETIARGQMQKEQQMLKQANKFLFCDTELLVTMIWSQFVFGKVSPWITEQLSKQKYNLILLTNIDIPWTFDPLREHPDHREELFYLYKKKLQDLHLLRNCLGHGK